MKNLWSKLNRSEKRGGGGGGGWGGRCENSQPVHAIFFFDIYIYIIKEYFFYI